MEHRLTERYSSPRAGKKNDHEPVATKNVFGVATTRE
jgi:hypothetical protein